MNFYVIAVLLSVGAVFSVQAMSIDEKAQMYKMGVEACGKELGASADDMAALLKKDENLSDSSKCVLNCVMKKFNLVGADGKLSMDGIKKMAAAMHPNDDSAAKICEEVGNKCMTAAGSGDSECEATFKYTKCFHEEMVARGLVPV